MSRVCENYLKAKWRHVRCSLEIRDDIQKDVAWEGLYNLLQNQVWLIIQSSRMRKILNTTFNLFIAIEDGYVHNMKPQCQQQQQLS